MPLTEDVRHAVTFARERDLLVAVRAADIVWPGKSVCDRGLMIDLSPMNEVRVEPGPRRAFAGGGALLYMLDSRSLEHGLITTAGVVSHTGVGGLTLGGGFGRLNREYGLTIDNLMSAEIVTASRRSRTVSKQQEPDLFWGLPGGGGNFGVVTRFEYQAPVQAQHVLSGTIAWPIERAAPSTVYGGWYPGPLRRDVRGSRHDDYAGQDERVRDGGRLQRRPRRRARRSWRRCRKIGKPSDDGIKVQDYMVMQTQEDGALARHPLLREKRHGHEDHARADRRDD